MISLKNFESSKLQNKSKVLGGGWIADLAHYLKCNWPEYGPESYYLNNDTKIRI